MNKIMTFLVGIAGLCLVSCQNDDIITPVTTDALALLPGDTRVGVSAELKDESGKMTVSRAEGGESATTYYAWKEIHASKEVNFVMFLPGGSDENKLQLYPKAENGLGMPIPFNTLATTEPFFTLMLKDFNLTEGNGRCVSRWTVLKADNGGQDNLWGWARLTANATGQPVLNYAMQRPKAKVTLIVQDEQGQPVNVANGKVSATLSLPNTLSEVIYTPEDETKGTSFRMYCSDITTLANDEAIDPDCIGLATYADGNGNTDFPLGNMVTSNGDTYYGENNNTLTDIVSATATHTKESDTYTLIEGGPQFDGSEKLTITVEEDPDGDGPQTTGTYSLKLSDVKLSDTEYLTALEPGKHYTLTVTLKHNTLVSATATISTWSNASADAEMDGEDGAKLPDNDNTNQ